MSPRYFIRRNGKLVCVKIKHAAEKTTLFLYNNVQFWSKGMELDLKISCAGNYHGIDERWRRRPCHVQLTEGSASDFGNSSNFRPLNKEVALLNAQSYWKRVNGEMHWPCSRLLYVVVYIILGSLFVISYNSREPALKGRRFVLNCI